MEQAVFNVEIFRQTLVRLKQLADVHQPRSDQAAFLRNWAYLQHGEGGIE
jgi:hypothetical protein